MNDQPRITIKVLFVLLGNFLKWMIPGVFVLLYCILLVPFLTDGAPPHADEAERKFIKRLPIGLLSFLGVTCLLITLFLLILIIVYPKMDIESKITFCAFACVGLLFGFSWTRIELKRISAALHKL